MLVECGLTRAIAGDGTEYTFRPSLANIAALGSPRSIVELYAALHGPRAEDEAAYVLATCCDTDPAELIGWRDFDSGQWRAGDMPRTEQVIVARHLMQHGMVGKADPKRPGQGKFVEEFHAAEFVSLARVHLGMSAADAEALSMTELQQLLEVKFPDAARKRDVPTREEYDALMARVMEGRRRG